MHGIAYRMVCYDGVVDHEALGRRVGGLWVRERQGQIYQERLHALGRTSAVGSGPSGCAWDRSPRSQCKARRSARRHA